MVVVNDMLRNVMALAAFALVGGLVARARRGPVLVPIVALLGIAACFPLHVLVAGFAGESFVYDIPWGLAALLAAWAFHAHSGWLRTRSWVGTVLLSAIFGDLFVASGLVSAEADPARRARLVLAASGASLLGVTSGELVLGLGHGSPAVLGLGLVLGLVGFVPGGGFVVRAAPSWRAAGLAAWVTLWTAPLVWLLVLSGDADYLATALETARLQLPGWDVFAAGAGALVATALAHEGGMALFASETLARALSLRGDGIREALLVGGSVGSGLPMLLVTRSRLRVGLPLWMLQVGLGMAFLWYRWS